MLEKTTIRLTLKGETRELEANIVTRGNGSQDVVTWASVTTTHGARSHVGTLYLRRNSSDEYRLEDCTDIGYHGMRGNGHARRSHFRDVSFL